MDLSVVPVELPADANVILGQSHFVKTVEDLYEALVGSVPGLRFGLAFCEASGPLASTGMRARATATANTAAAACDGHELKVRGPAGSPGGPTSAGPTVDGGAAMPLDARSPSAPGTPDAQSDASPAAPPPDAAPPPPPAS